LLQKHNATKRSKRTRTPMIQTPNLSRHRRQILL
jgi:hypothetical protein